jgi:hypothetical protein
VRRRSRTRRVVEWAGIICLSTVITLWVVSILGTVSLATATGSGVHIKEGVIEAYWSSPGHSFWTAPIGSTRWGFEWPRWNRHTGGTVVYLPLWLPLLALLSVLTIPRFLDRRTVPGHCQQCGYNLTGNVSGQCPECGAPLRSKGEAR